MRGVIVDYEQRAQCVLCPTRTNTKLRFSDGAPRNVPMQLSPVRLGGGVDASGRARGGELRGYPDHEWRMTTIYRANMA